MSLFIYYYFVVTFLIKSKKKSTDRKKYLEEYLHALLKRMQSNIKLFPLRVPVEEARAFLHV